MDLRTFTLGAMFAMQLHKHAAEISAVTAAAAKEMTIEVELRKVLLQPQKATLTKLDTLCCRKLLSRKPV
jgi:hypothetical protein